VEHLKNEYVLISFIMKKISVLHKHQPTPHMRVVKKNYLNKKTLYHFYQPNRFLAMKGVITTTYFAQMQVVLE